MSVELTYREKPGDSPMAVQGDNPLPVKQVGVAPLPGYDAKYIASQATFLLKNTTGVLHSIVCNTPVASGVISVYDDLAAVTVNLIAVITLPATLLSQGPMTALYDVQFKRGLTVVTSGASAVWTVTYK